MVTLVGGYTIDRTPRTHFCIVGIIGTLSIESFNDIVRLNQALSDKIVSDTVIKIYETLIVLKVYLCLTEFPYKSLVRCLMTRELLEIRHDVNKDLLIRNLTKLREW